MGEARLFIVMCPDQLDVTLFLAYVHVFFNTVILHSVPQNRDSLLLYFSQRGSEFIITQSNLITSFQPSFLRLHAHVCKERTLPEARFITHLKFFKILRTMGRNRRIKNHEISSSQLRHLRIGISFLCSIAEICSRLFAQHFSERTSSL